MSYKATVLKIMLASPGDVSQERRLARDVIQEWNVIHAEDRRIVLMPVGWETHSTPQMGDRAQAIINKQVLADCDLLVAIFWTRLGSPTGVAASGTVEEIEEHLEADKPALIYFSTAPVRLDSVDNTQYTALLEFKESCRSRGLVEEFEELAAFREKFARHLAQTIIRLFAIDTPGEGNIEPPQRKGPSLTVAAQELLYEAAKDSNGVIIRIGTLDGTHVQTNGRDFVETGDARSEAKWRAAVDELHHSRLVEDRAGNGEVFFVTDSGYVAADTLGKPDYVQSANQPADDDLLDDSKVNILKLLYRQDNLQTEQIAQTLNFQIQTATFHLEELKSSNMVSYHMHRPPHDKSRPIMVWSIEQEGRKYLHNKGEV
jgi:hypothetical protein